MLEAGERLLSLSNSRNKLSSTGVNPHSPSPGIAGGRGGRAGKNVAVGKGIFKVYLYFPLACSHFVNHNFK